MIQINTFTEKEKESGLELYVVGGFDEQRYSKDLGIDLLTAFHKLPYSIKLKMACIYKLNNLTLPSGNNVPIVRGIAVDMQTGEVFPATFEAKGPDTNIRGIRYLGPPYLVSVRLLIFETNLLIFNFIGF